MNTNQHYPQSLIGLQRISALGEKSLHFLYFLLGISVSFGALYTLLKTVSYIGMQLPLYTFAVLAAYTLVQGILGYGFLYMRKWLLPISIFVCTVDLVALIILNGTVLTLDAATLMRMGFSTVLVLFLYTTRNTLVGSYKSPVPLTLYTVSFIVAAIYSLSYAYSLSPLNTLM